MFFKKKPTAQPSQAPNLAPLFIQIAKEFCKAYGVKSADDTLSTELVFDDSQHITDVQNLTVNGLPKIPDPELIEAANHLTMALNDLPPEYKIKALSIAVENNNIKTSASYAN